MIVSKDEAREILRGELDEYHLPQRQRAPKVGALEPVQTRVGARATCYVRILDRWPHVGGGMMIRFELAPKTVAGRFMTRTGETDDPDRVVRDASIEHEDPASFRGGWESAGAPGEPEMVDKQEQTRQTKERRMYGDQGAAARRLELEAQPLIDRIESAIAEAERLGLDSSRDVARLEAGWAKLARRIVLAKQQRRR